MKIGIISDIHLDINKDFDVKGAISRAVKKRGIETLLIPGDVSNNYQETLKAIDELIESTGINIYFIPGNHDLWDIDKKINDTKIIEKELMSHHSCICNKVIKLTDTWALIGETGWYDYSFGSSKFTEEDFKKMSMYGRTWQDSINLDWHENNKEHNDKALNSIRENLLSVKGMNTIVMTHMISHEAFKVPETKPLWDYFNAYLGSDKYGRLYEEMNVKYGIMGHVHYRHEHEENGVRYICACLNYHNEWSTHDVDREVNKAMWEINI